MENSGGRKGLFCIHDHLNNFSIDYKNIRLTYGYSIAYLAYFENSEISLQKGCTIISLSQDRSFNCEESNYYQDKYQFLSEGKRNH